MKKYKYFSSLLLCILFISLFPVTAYANSSWVWISETRPYDVLPFVMMVTLLTEALAINRLPKIRQPRKVLCFVVLGNLCSFGAPYLFQYLACVSQKIYTFSQALEHLPVYTVGVGYLIVTLLVETPIVYFSLKKHTDNNRRLLFSILLSNVITTLFTALTERLLCRGLW